MGANEYLERLEGKIRKCLFFYVKIFYNNSVNQNDRKVSSVKKHAIIFADKDLRKHFSKNSQRGTNSIAVR